MQIEISGIKIEVQKKKIKTLRLSVVPPNGEVRVSAPMCLSDESIAAFVHSKLGWIQKQQKRFADQPRESAHEYLTGETLYVFGQPYILRVEYGGRGNSMLLDRNEAVLTVRKQSTAKQREAFINEWYRSLLKEKIELYLPKWERLTGLYCNAWQTKNMTTRWGTCNTSTRKIWLNLQLAKKPVECLEYVILHELAHLRVKNHGKDFVAIMDGFMPDWREVKRLLNSL